MELNNLKVYSVSCGRVETKVNCGWRERTNGGGREYLLVNHSCDMKLVTCKEGDGDVSVRSECFSRYSNSEVKEMKRLLRRYMKDIKLEKRIQAAV